MKRIRIQCKGNRAVPYNELIPFQKELKTLTKENAEKLKNSIKEHGWIAPIFVWENNILDGHARLKSLQQLLDEGYSVGDIPVVDIIATSAKEAALKLLTITSSYNTMTEDGLLEFVTDFGLVPEAFANLELVGVDTDAFLGYLTGSGWPPKDVELVSEFSEDTNFIIKCESLDELEELKELIGTKADKKITFQKFKDLMSGKVPVRVPKKSSPKEVKTFTPHVLPERPQAKTVAESLLRRR